MDITTTMTVLPDEKSQPFDVDRGRGIGMQVLSLVYKKKVDNLLLSSYATKVQGFLFHFELYQCFRWRQRLVLRDLYIIGGINASYPMSMALCIRVVTYFLSKRVTVNKVEIK